MVALGSALIACEAGPDAAASEDATHASDTGARLLTSPAEAEDMDASDGSVRVRLEAATRSYEVAGDVVDGYAYNGQNPGPTIRARVGDTVTVEFTNDLDAATTIHWHGIGAPVEMDGVTWLENPVEPGQSFTYTFAVRTAGTFWYHPHVDVERQVDLGLYGALVVEDPDEPEADAEFVVIWDAWGESELEEEHTMPAPDSLTWTANGVLLPTLALEAGERARLRLINAANTAYLDLRWPEIHQIGGDQGLLAAASSPESILLAPGDRADVEIVPTNDGFSIETAPYTASGGAAYGDNRSLLGVDPVEGDDVADPLEWPHSGEVPSLDTTWTDIVYVLQGGGDPDGWMINGESYPDVTVERIALGAETIVEVRNLSSTEHPFHFHGNSFEVLSVNGVPPVVRTIEDTWNVPIRDVVRLRVVPDNAGAWMVHCHLLGHEAGGMMTVLEVE